MNILATTNKDYTYTLIADKKSEQKFLEEAFKLLDWEGLKMRLPGGYVCELWFADDIVLFSNDGDKMRKND